MVEMKIINIIKIHLGVNHYPIIRLIKHSENKNQMTIYGCKNFQKQTLNIKKKGCRKSQVQNVKSKFKMSKTLIRVEDRRSDEIDIQRSVRNTLTNSF